LHFSIGFIVIPATAYKQISMLLIDLIGLPACC
jgi:hypothetical protein